MSDSELRIPCWALDRVIATRSVRVSDSTIQKTAERCAAAGATREDDAAVLLWALAEERAQLHAKLAAVWGAAYGGRPGRIDGPFVRKDYDPPRPINFGSRILSAIKRRLNRLGPVFGPFV